MAKKDDKLIVQPTQNCCSISRDRISSVASKIAAQPFHCSYSQAWGILTPISQKALKRLQGIYMVLRYDKHSIGRGVKETQFQILDPSVTSLHCYIYRDKVSVFLKDLSTNGTYVNWVKLRKSSPEFKLRHGDIISLAYVPEHELAYTYVFREIQTSSSVLNSGGGLLKRKAAELGVENKKLKRTCIDASGGPISLDDFRSLQKSNTELHKLLEEHVATVASLRSQTSAVTEKNDDEMRELKESLSKSYRDQLTALNQSLVDKDDELAELYSVSSKQKYLIEYFSKRLTAASMHSYFQTNEIINSLTGSISELKTLLNEERDQRREEREKVSADLKVSVQRVQAEAAVEIKRVVDDALKREKGQAEIISKLQEAEKETSCLVETLKTKLEDTRQNLVKSDNIICKLEAQIREEHLGFGRNRKRIEELERDRKRLSEQLECEKVAREEAWAKVSALELEINQSDIKNKDGTVTKGFVLAETARGSGSTAETEHLEMESQGQGGNVNSNLRMLTDDELIAKDVLENLIHSFPE